MPKTRLANGVMRARRVLDLHADRHAPQEHGHVLRVHVRVALRVLLEAHDVRLVQDHEQDHDGLVIRETTRLAHGAPRARRVPDREAVPAEPQRHGDDEEALGALLRRSSSRGLRWCPRTCARTGSRTGSRTPGNGVHRYPVVGRGNLYCRSHFTRSLRDLRSCSIARTKTWSSLPPVQ